MTPPPNRIFYDPPLTRKSLLTYANGPYVLVILDDFVTLGCKEHYICLALIGYFIKNMGLMPGRS